MLAENNIIFEHEDFVVLNKPAGLAVHAHENKTLLDFARDLFRYPDLHPAHRLDLGTSGAIVFAKNPKVNRELSSLFAARTVQKLYIALSVKKPKKKQGKISGDMGKSRGGSYKLLQTQQNPAVTYLQSLGLSENTLGENAVLPVSPRICVSPRIWLLRPVTGKTHQLRVALKALGSPILGDERYGGDAADRLYLHAYGLRFIYRGQIFEFKCLPKQGQFFIGIEKYLSSIGNVWNDGWPKALMDKYHI